MIRRSLLVVIALSACGAEQALPAQTKIVQFDTFVEERVSVEARPHFVEFIQYCDASVPSVKTRCLSNLNRLTSVSTLYDHIPGSEPDTVGVCEFSTQKNSSRRVTLRGDAFDHDSLSFKTLVWHELGHCLLDLDHVDDGDVHIMNSYIPYSTVLALEWADLVKELFGTSAPILNIINDKDR